MQTKTIPKSSERRTLWVIFVAPLALATLILFGLFSALLGQRGVWFWLSWIALTVPIFVAARFGLWPKKYSG